MLSLTIVHTHRHLPFGKTLGFGFSGAEKEEQNSRKMYVSMDTCTGRTLKQESKNEVFVLVLKRQFQRSYRRALDEEQHQQRTKSTAFSRKEIHYTIREIVYSAAS